MLKVTGLLTVACFFAATIAPLSLSTAQAEGVAGVDAPIEAKVSKKKKKKTFTPLPVRHEGGCH